MPNYTLTPPRSDQALTSFAPTPTLLALYHLTPPRSDQAFTSFDPAITLLPLYHLTPPRSDQGAQFFDPRVFSVTEPDEILKNETRTALGQ
jgi:hypothetical protein